MERLSEQRGVIKAAHAQLRHFFQVAQRGGESATQLVARELAV